MEESKDINQIVDLTPKCNIVYNSPADDIYKKITLNEGISNEHLYVKKSPIPKAGLGVFTKKKLYPSDPIEYCHSIVLDWRQRYPLDAKFRKYIYSFDCNCNDCQKYGKKLILPLGYGSIYNGVLKKEQANAAWCINLNLSLQIFVCIKPIKIGEEILVYYGEGYTKTYLNQNIDK